MSLSAIEMQQQQQAREQLIADQLVQQQQNPTLLLTEIQEVLKGDKEPSESTELPKLLKTLKKLAEDHATDPLDKAFVEYAKSTSMGSAVLFNSVNLAISGISFVVEAHYVDNKFMPRIHWHHKMFYVYIAMSLAFLPLSILTTGMAHALEHRIQWKKKVSYMLMLVMLYMIVMCILFGYFLIPNSDLGALIITITAGILSLLVIIPWIVFKTPNDLLAKILDDGTERIRKRFATGA